MSLLALSLFYSQHMQIQNKSQNTYMPAHHTHTHTHTEGRSVGEEECHSLDYHFNGDLTGYQDKAFGEEIIRTGRTGLSLHSELEQEGVTVRGALERRDLEKSE